MEQFGMQDSRLDRVQPSVVPLYVVIILFHLPVIAQHLDSFSEARIIGGDSAAFPACAKILPWVKAERGCTPHGSGLHPAVESLREILSAVRLASVLYHCETVVVRYRQN